MVLDRALAAEVRRLGRRLEGIAGGNPRHAALDPTKLSEAISETIVCLPVYRTYLDRRRGQHRAADHAVLAKALDDARARGRADAAALQLLADGLLLEKREMLSNAELAERIGFVQRFQQTCVAAAAKGVEDTAFYVYVPLVSRNEVGGEPDAPLADADSVLHEANQLRARLWPRSMLCTSTHDTKRSADVRARLDVLSEVAGEWRDRVRRWHRWNRRHRTRIRWRYAPDRNSEYLLPHRHLAAREPFGTNRGAGTVTAGGHGEFPRARRGLHGESRARGEAAHQLDRSQSRFRGSAP